MRRSRGGGDDARRHLSGPKRPHLLELRLAAEVAEQEGLQYISTSDKLQRAQLAVYIADPTRVLHSVQIQQRIAWRRATLVAAPLGRSGLERECQPLRS